jgi:hypothetical protein
MAGAGFVGSAMAGELRAGGGAAMARVVVVGRGCGTAAGEVAGEREGVQWGGHRSQGERGRGEERPRRCVTA